MMSRLTETGRVNQTEAAAILGITVRGFAKWKIEPDDKEGNQKIYRVASLLDEVKQRERAKALKEFEKTAPAYDDNGDLIDVELEKKKKLRAERIWQEIKNAEAIGELAPIDLLTSVLRDCLQTANAFLESIPAVIKRTWPEADGSILDAIERECAKVRNSIADARIEYSESRMAEYSEISSLGSKKGT